MRKKLKNSGGFSMVEMLCAVAILVMLCLITSSGLGMAMRSYRDLTAEAEIQVLMSDLSDALADKLRYAVVTQKCNLDGVSIGDPTCSIKDVIVNPSDNVVKVVVTGASSEEERALLPTGAYGSKLSSGYPSGNQRYTPVIADDAFIRDDTGPTPVFKITLEVKDTLGKVSKKTELTVRCLNPIKKEVQFP